MRFVADENLPVFSILKLRESGLDIISISEVSPRISDLQVIQLAEKENGIILTFDKDFGELIFKQAILFTTGIILFRFIPTYPNELADVLLSILTKADIKLYGYFTIVERDYIRQRLLKVKSD